MAAPIALRDDCDGATLRQLAKASSDAEQTRRLLSLALIYDGVSRGEAARLGGVTLQIIRDSVLRFNVEGPDGLRDRKAPGGRPKLNAQQLQALREIVESGPIPAIQGVVSWRLKDLSQWLFEEFHISLHKTRVGRALTAMGFRKISARPRHYAQNELTAEAFKNIPGQAGRASRPTPGGLCDRVVVSE